MIGLVVTFTNQRGTISYRCTQCGNMSWYIYKSMFEQILLIGPVIFTNQFGDQSYWLYLLLHLQISVGTKVIDKTRFYKYSVTSMARTRMARLPWMTRTSF